MFPHHCFQQTDKHHIGCHTQNAKLFMCRCCNLTHGLDCSDHYLKDVFHVHSDHKARKQEIDINLFSSLFESFGNDTEDTYDYEDEDLGGDEEEENIDYIDIKYADVNITDIEHLYNECKNRKLLPLHCFIERNNQAVTACECKRDINAENVHLCEFDSNAIWNKHPCDVTYEHNQIHYLEHTFHKLYCLSMFLIFLYLILLLIYIFSSKLKKCFRLNRIETRDEVFLFDD